MRKSTRGGLSYLNRKRFKKLIRGTFAEFSPLAETSEQQDMMKRLFKTAMEAKISPSAASKCTYHSYKQLYHLYIFAIGSTLFSEEDYYDTKAF